MTLWNSAAAVIWMYRPTSSPAWCERLGCSSQNCPHPQLKRQINVTVGDCEFQSHPCLTIHYTHNISHWDSAAAVIWMYRPTPSAAWCERLGCSSQNCPHPQLKKPA
eukprot:scaffold82984_cov54-Cyclotella_meneghiniana.AAC.1